MRKLLNEIRSSHIFKVELLRNVFIASLLIGVGLPLCNVFLIYPLFAQLLIDDKIRDAKRTARHLASFITKEDVELTQDSLPQELLLQLKIHDNVFHLVKMKVFGKNGDVLFSTVPGEIGKINQKKYFFETVAKGGIYTNIVEKGAYSSEGERISAHTVETYVPFMRGETFLGAIEIYHDITPSKNRLDGLIARSWALESLIASSLFVAVLVVSSRASKMISERQQAHDALTKSEHLNRGVLNSVTANIAVLDQGGVITAVNRAWENFARGNGASPTTVRGVGVNYLGTCELASGDDAHIAREALVGIRNVLNKKHPLFTLEYPCPSPEERRWYVLHATPLAWDLGGAVVSHFDITGRKLIEDQIQSSLREKETLLRELQHRVKNNLQVIVSLLRLKSARIADQQYAEALEDITGRIQTMALIYEQLYRTEDIDRIHFGQYIKDLAVTLFRSYAAGANNVELKVEVQDVILEIDAAIHCGLLINEILSNSLKYAFSPGAKGEIRIDLNTGTRNWVELTISDNGVGLPETLDFSKAKTFGLQLIQQLVREQLDGRIELNRSGGTMYRIQFKRLGEWT